jgi:hypothetical protein
MPIISVLGARVRAYVYLSVIFDGVEHPFVCISLLIGRDEKFVCVQTELKRINGNQKNKWKSMVSLGHFLTVL